MIKLYNMVVAALLLVGLPVVLPYLVLSSKRRPILLQRLGIVLPHPISCGSAKPENPIWVHALSVGEVLATIPLIKALGHHYTNRPIVLSASTLAGHNIALAKLGSVVDGVFLFPYDLIFSINRVVACIRPSMVVMVETDIWPNFLFAMKRRGVPVTLANAKLSQRSFSGYRRLSTFATKLFSCFSALCCQGRDDAERFRRLGIPEDIISVTGNIKFDQNEMPLSTGEVTALQKSLGISRRQSIWVAGSTHNGEEAIILQAFTLIKNENPRLMLVVAPRNPERSGAVTQIFSAGGFDVAALSTLGDRVSRAPADVIVIDTLGMLTKLYALADVAMVGGSLIQIRGIGGHNPLEPAAFAKPIIFGPHMHNFREIAAMLTAAGGAIQVGDGNALYKTVNDLLNDRDRARTIGQSAHHVFAANKGAVSRTMAIITGKLVPEHRQPDGAPDDLRQGS